MGNPYTVRGTPHCPLILKKHHLQISITTTSHHPHLSPHPLRSSQLGPERTAELSRWIWSTFGDSKSYRINGVAHIFLFFWMVKKSRRIIYHFPLIRQLWSLGIWVVRWHFPITHLGDAQQNSSLFLRNRSETKTKAVNNFNTFRFVDLFSAKGWETKMLTTEQLGEQNSNRLIQVYLLQYVLYIILYGLYMFYCFWLGFNMFKNDIAKHLRFSFSLINITYSTYFPNQTNTPQKHL